MNYAICDSLSGNCTGSGPVSRSFYSSVFLVPFCHEIEIGLHEPVNLYSRMIKPFRTFNSFTTELYILFSTFKIYGSLVLYADKRPLP